MDERRNIIAALSEDNFNSLVTAYIKGIYNADEVWVCNGPYDGGKDIVAAKGDKEIRINFQATVQKNRIENKIKDDVNKLERALKTGVAKSKKLSFFCSQHISQSKADDGTIACISIMNLKKRTRAIVIGITNIPMLNADIVTGISFMLLFISMGLRFGIGTILLSHITFCIPYVILSVMPRMKQLNPHLYEAALDLGSGPVYGFFRVVLPDLMPGVLSGFLMAFTMSLDDFIITHFTKGAGVDTLSTKIYTEVKKGIKPEMYALSTIIFLTVLMLLLFINKAPADKRTVSKSI